MPQDTRSITPPIDVIARLAGVAGGTPSERMHAIRMALDRVEIELVASILQRALDGDVDAAEFLLSTRFGYRPASLAGPLAARSTVNIQTGEASA